MTGPHPDLESIEIVYGEPIPLWYRWLPNDEFPAPVELIQPLSFREMTGIQAACRRSPPSPPNHGLAARGTQLKESGPSRILLLTTLL